MLDDIFKWSRDSTAKRMMGTVLFTITLAGASATMALIGYFIISSMLMVMSSSALVCTGIIVLLLVAVHIILWN